MKKLIILLIIFIGSSCSDSKKIFDVTGIVLAIDLNNKKVLIDHDSIPNFMMPMVMHFNVENKNVVKSLSNNDSVKFKFVITETSSYATDFNIIGKHINNDNISIFP